MTVYRSFRLLEHVESKVGIKINILQIIKSYLLKVWFSFIRASVIITMNMRHN